MERLVAKHRDPSRTELLKRLQWEYPPDPAGAHPAVHVMRTGEVKWSPTMSEQFLRETTRDAEHFAIIKELGFRSYAAVPIGFRGDVLGCLTLVSCNRPFRRGDVEFAELLSQQVGAVLANARRYDHSVEVARELQFSMLPPSLPRVDGRAICHPVRGGFRRPGGRRRFLRPGHPSQRQVELHDR